MCTQRNRVLWVLLPLLTACGSSSGPASAVPTVSVTAPSLDVVVGSEGGVVQVAYVDNDVDDVARTDLFADRDGDLSTPADQVVIALNRPEMNGVPQVVPWQVMGVAPGSYRIIARTEDGIHVVESTALGRVLVNAQPTLQILSPAADVVVSRGGLLEVEYIDQDDDDIAITWLAADLDGDPTTSSSGDVVSAPRSEMNGLVQRQVLELREARVGDLFTILGTTWDGLNEPVTVAAAGTAEVRNVGWARAATSPINGGAGDVALHPDASCVIGGSFSSSMIFGPGLQLTTSGGSDGFIARYQQDGTALWAKRIGGENANVRALATHAGGSLAAGSLRDAVTFGMGEPGETTVVPIGVQDAYVARHESDGAFTWVARIVNSFCNPSSIASDEGGSCVVVGRFDNTAIFGMGEPSETTLVSMGSDDAFVAKYDPQGALVWARRAGGPLQDIAYGVALRSDGSCVVTGSFRDTADFGTQVLTSDGGADIFLMAYAPDGAVLWARRAGGVLSEDEGKGVDVAPSGDICLAGRFSGSPTFGPGEPNQDVLTAEGSSDVFLARYDASGSLRWVVAAGGTGLDNTGELVSLPDGSMVFAGTFSGVATFGAMQGNETVLTAVGSEVFIARYASTGALLWAKRVAANVASANGVDSAADGSVVLAGTFTNQLTAAPGEPGEVTLFPDAGSDPYLIRYNADGGL